MPGVAKAHHGGEVGGGVRSDPIQYDPTRGVGEGGGGGGGESARTCETRVACVCVCVVVIETEHLKVLFTKGLV